MVYTHSTSHSFDAPWSTLVLAFLCRYPNPYSDHVLSSDILSRTVDPSTRSLRTVRLLLKRGALPRWAPKGILSENWVLEVCDVFCAPDMNHPSSPTSTSKEIGNGTGTGTGTGTGSEERAAPVMHSRSFNLEHRSVLQVIESIRLENSTAITTGTFKSSLPFASLRRRVEKHGLKRFISHTANSRTGVALVVHALQSRPHDFLASHNFDFSTLPPHPLTSSATRAALESVHHQDEHDETIYDDQYTASSLASRFLLGRWSASFKTQPDSDTLTHAPTSSSSSSTLSTPPPPQQQQQHPNANPPTMSTWSGRMYEYLTKAYRWLSPPSTKDS